MSEKVEWKQIDLETSPKLTNLEETPIMLPTKNGKYQIKIVNDQGNYNEIKNIEVDEQLARLLINSKIQDDNIVAQMLIDTIKARFCTMD